MTRSLPAAPAPCWAQGLPQQCLPPLQAQQLCSHSRARLGSAKTELLPGRDTLVCPRALQAVLTVPLSFGPARDVSPATGCDTRAIHAGHHLLHRKTRKTWLWQSSATGKQIQLPATACGSQGTRPQCHPLCMQPTPAATAPCPAEALTKREELSFRMVLALPKASMAGLEIGRAHV